MKWVLEVSDSPKNKDYPIIGYQISDNGVKRGPVLLKVNDVVESLISPLIASNDVITAHTLDNNFKDEKRIPTLPFGTVGYSSTEDGKERISMIVDKGIWPVKYRDKQETFFIGFPKLLIQYSLVSMGSTGHKRITQTKIFALKDNHQMVNDKTELYVFPFPNVSKSNGNVCWGSNSDLTVSNLTELERFFTLFLAAPFNEDYGMQLADGYSNFGKYIELEKDKPFNDDLLLPIQLGLKFGNLHGSEFIHPKCR